MPPTGEVDRRREFVRAARDDPKPPPAPGPRRDASGAAIQRCAAAGCERLSANHAGYTAPTNVKRFWCADHADQAAPGDSEPFDANTVRVDPLTGRWLPPPEVEEHFERQRQKEAEERRQRDEAKAAERERIATLREQYERSEPRREPVAGIPQRLAEWEVVRDA